MAVPNPLGPIFPPPGLVVPLAQGMAQGAEAAAAEAEKLAQEAEDVAKGAGQALATGATLAKAAVFLGALWLLDEGNRSKAGSGIEVALAAAALLL